MEFSFNGKWSCAEPNGRHDQQTLNLANFSIAQIRVLRPLPFLVSLDLQGNNLESLPESLFTLLSHVSECNLSLNTLTRLPSVICRWSQLRELHLAHNKLTKLPQRLFECQNLRTLDVTHNQLAYIPAEIRNAGALRHFFVDGNYFRILDAKSPKAVTIVELKNMATQVVGFNLLSDPHAYCAELKVASPGRMQQSAQNARSTQIPEPFVHRQYKSNLQIDTALDKIWTQLQTRKQSRCHFPESCIFAVHAPLAYPIKPIITTLNEKDIFMETLHCSICEIILFFESCITLLEVFVACNIPVPVKYHFCSYVCRSTHLRRNKKDVSIMGSGLGRVTQVDGQVGAPAFSTSSGRVRLRTWDGSTPSFPGNNSI